MRLQCLKKAFRVSGKPILFLTLLCVGLGVLFSLLDSEAGIALIAAGLGAITLFLLLGSTLGCRPPVK